MNTERDKIGREEVERIARLAALAVDEQSLPLLTQQIARIIEYVSQIEAADLPPAKPEDFWLSAAPRQPLRADEVRPADLERNLESIAPAMRDGFFLVPRLPAMED
ncbi:MAG: glutamyl-tRNA(Gln) amidotransferase subunit C [Gemmatimonadales bacterium]|nr:MAG: glutamyl-tRNA(Gln) amidotransferase subunit C [Gemmatimonadales bacterium]